ncbi:MAG: hypothetical protein AAFZ14_13635, partial [Pseudomonadota bacterium]
MAANAEGSGSLARLIGIVSARGQSLLLAAVLLGTMGVLAPEPLIQMGLLAAAATLMMLGFAVTMIERRDRSSQDRTMQAVSGFIEKDSAPSFVCTSDGA